MTKRVIKADLNSRSISKMIQQLQLFRMDLHDKLMRICKEAAELGATRARILYAGTPTDYINDVDVRVEPSGNGYKIIASGHEVCFLEFGAGVTYGYGHPTAEQYGMGPGTYNPGSDNWKNPKGWTSNQGIRTLGNAPAKAMYEADKEIQEKIYEIAKRVFNNG